MWKEEKWVSDSGVNRFMGRLKNIVYSNLLGNPRSMCTEETGHDYHP